MGVDLRLVSYSRGEKPKGTHRPAEILRPLIPPERQPLTYRGLVYLDDTNADCFQIENLVTNRKCQLATGTLAEGIGGPV